MYSIMYTRECTTLANQSVITRVVWCVLFIVLFDRAQIRTDDKGWSGRWGYYALHVFVCVCVCVVCVE